MDNDSYGLGSGQPNIPKPGAPGPEHFRTVLILAIAAVITVAVAIIFTVSSNRSQKVASVITPEPTASASPGASTSPTPASGAPAQPTYNGFDSLSNDGLSSDQENDAEYAFVKYAKSKGINITTVTLDPATLNIALHTVDANTNTASFNVELNNTVEYEAKLNYTGLTAADLILIDPTSSAQVYDSGTIDVYNGIGDN